MNKAIDIFDSTLRDGAQGQGISFSLEDKVKIVHALDDFGIDYIEAGNPGSLPAPSHSRRRYSAHRTPVPQRPVPPDGSSRRTRRLC